MIILGIKQVSAQQTGKSADSLFQSACYESALIHYEYQAFQSRDSKQVELALWQKAACYKQLQEFEQAIGELERIKPEYLPDSLKATYSDQLILCHYLAGHFNTTNRIASITKQAESGLSVKSRLVEILAYNERQQWDTALVLSLILLDSLAYDSAYMDSLKAKLLCIYQADKQPDLLDPDKAQRWASIIPGAGQVYAKHPAEGVFSFILQTACLSFAVWQFSNYYLITGYFGGFGLWRKFYFGSRRRSKLLVEAYNQDLTAGYNNELKIFLLKMTANRF